MKLSLKAIMSTSIIFTSLFFDYGCIGQAYDADDLFRENAKQNEISKDKLSQVPISNSRREYTLTSSYNAHLKQSSSQLKLHLYDCDGNEIKSKMLIPYDLQEGQCDSIFARTELSDHGKDVFVSANYTWEVADSSLVRLHDSNFPQDQSGKGFEVLQSMLTNPQLTNEPNTELRVCANPKTQDKSTPSVCRTIAIQAVVNLDGYWCFQGPGFEPDKDADCQALRIEQHGRHLFLEDDSQGDVYEKQVDFFYQGYEYRAFLNQSSEINGQVIVGNDVEGDFSAFRLSN